MIAKINLDGQEHMAIVFSKYVDFEQIQEFKTALNSCMQIASQDEDRKQAENFYYLHSLMEEMELSTEQINEMFFFYFGKSNWSRNSQKSQKKLCEIYL